MVYLQYVGYLQFNFHWILEPTIFGQIRGQWAVLSLSAPVVALLHSVDEGEAALSDASPDSDLLRTKAFGWHISNKWQVPCSRRNPLPS